MTGNGKRQDKGIESQSIPFGIFFKAFHWLSISLPSSCLWLVYIDQYCNFNYSIKSFFPNQFSQFSLEKINFYHSRPFSNSNQRTFVVNKAIKLQFESKISFVSCVASCDKFCYTSYNLMPYKDELRKCFKNIINKKMDNKYDRIKLTSMSKKKKN